MLIAFILSLVASIYQIYDAKKKISQEKQSVLSINFVNQPEFAAAGENKSFSYHVEAPPSFLTSSTTIYYSYDATPSALTKNDSPEAVRYANHDDNYFLGDFKLPQTFESSLNFPHPGTIYFRAYAKVGNDHLWTKEQKLMVK